MNAFEAIAPIAALIVTAWVIRTVLAYRRRLKVAQLQAEMQNRLMDKFDSPDEMMRYLGSEAGQRFVKSATMERANPYGRILGAIQAGLILTLVGGAALVFRAELPSHDDALAFSFLGLLGVALGLGFLISALAAYLLSKKWGVINGDGGGLSGE